MLNILKCQRKNFYLNNLTTSWNTNFFAFLQIGVTICDKKKVNNFYNAIAKLVFNFF